jgi:hypothetical protein
MSEQNVFLLSRPVEGAIIRLTMSTFPVLMSSPGRFGCQQNKILFVSGCDVISFSGKMGLGI